jgi:hypothetical protein
LSRFRRANQGKIFEGDTALLVEQTNAYYEGLQKTIKGLSHNRGYNSYFESWNPTALTEEEVIVDGLKHLFVTQNLDQRVEDALPLLAKIQQQGTAMKEANIFEAWVDNLAEGTWALPDDKEKQLKLVELLSKDFPVGADATNATEQLYDLLGDDELFDQLETLAEKDPDADCRQVVMDRMQMLSDHPEVQAVLTAVQIDPTAEMNPAEPTDAGMSADPDDAQIPANEEVKDPATQTEDPAGTDQPSYPEYQDSLLDILRIAGVPAEERPAPDYEEEIVETDLEDVECIGGDASNAFIKNVSTNQRDTDVNEEEEETDEGKLGALGGGVLGMAATKTPGGAMAGAKLGSAIQDRLDNKDESKETPLQGKYGHSGKMKEVSKHANFLDRLRELSGMMRSDKI